MNPENIDLKKKYKPNFIPLKTRIFVSMGVAYLLIFSLAVFATGYVFMPSKYGGGFMLSGIPALLIALSSIILCVAVGLTIIDHYDKRQNEHVYLSMKKKCYWISGYLFVSAPVIEVLEMILRHSKVDIFSRFHGFAETYTFYRPQLNQYVGFFETILDVSIWYTVASTVLFCFGLIIHKYFKSVPKKIVLLLLSTFFITISFSLVIFTLKDFMSGEVEGGRIVYTAIEAPAKFNAVLLTNFALGLVMLIASIVGVLGLLLKRIKISP